jgi:hypothetical protein
MPMTATLPGVPQLPPGAVVLAVVSVVLFRHPDGTEDVTTEAVNADGGEVPVLTVIGLLTTAATDLATGRGGGTE